MATSKKKGELHGPPAPYRKTPLQMEQWAAYEALCALREEEAKARSAAAKVVEVKRALLQNIRLDSSRFQEAEQLRGFARVVMARIDPEASSELKLRAEEWRRQVLMLADELDPTDVLIAGFAADLDGRGHHVPTFGKPANQTEFKTIET